MSKVNFRESCREEPTNICHIETRLYVFNHLRCNSDDGFVYGMQARYQGGVDVDLPGYGLV
jgi:hypothetical protein